MRKYKHYIVPVLFLLIVSCPPDHRTVDRPHRPSAPPGLTGTRSGLLLDKSRVEDIQATLGPTMVFKTTLGSPTSYMCYVSTFDFTLVSFTLERNVMRRLRLLSDKHHYSRWDWCTATPLSADDLTLANGLTLAMNPGGVIGLVGDAHRKESGLWMYTYGYTLPTHKSGAGPVNGVSGRRISMKLKFSDSRLVGIDLQAAGANSSPAATP